MKRDDISPTVEETGHGDEALIDRVREGDNNAYAELWDHYVAAARHSARKLVRPQDVDDVVAEAFATTLHTIRAGKGPRVMFRPYLVTTVKNTAIRWNTRESRFPTQDIDDLDDVLAMPATLSLATNELLLNVFRELPERWQQVLWFFEVEKMSTAEIGRRMGLTPHSVSTLAFRAREGLRDGWYQAHVSTAPVAEECRETMRFLGAYFTQRLSGMRHKRVAEHLAGCASCSARGNEMTRASTELYSTVLPAVVAGGGVSALVGSSSVPGTAAALVGVAAPVGASLTATASALGVGKVLALAAGVMVAVMAVGGGVLASLPQTPTSTPPVPAATDQVQPDADAEASLSDSGSPTAADSTTLVGFSSNPPPWQAAAEAEPADGELTFDCDLCVFSERSFALSGTASPHAEVTLVLSSATMAPRTVQTTVGPDGLWSLNPGPMADGSYQVVAYQSIAGERSGEVSQQFSVNSAVTVAAPVVTTVDTGDGRYSPLVSGRGTAGQQVFVWLNNVLTTGVVAADGTWSVSAAHGARAGSNTLVAQLVDPVSRVSAR